MKTEVPPHRSAPRPKRRAATGLAIAICLAYLAVDLLSINSGGSILARLTQHACTSDAGLTPSYTKYPQLGDPFHFLPCTNATRPPLLDDPYPAKTWASLYEPNPAHWGWGRPKNKSQNGSSSGHGGRGIYLCGYLDVPLDWTNSSDPRITRLAVTKYQVSGPFAGASKSDRTIVIEPGGPGGSGTSYVWRAAEELTDRLSGGILDVLGWDPRGVNTTQPRAACFPYDADRDRWWQLGHRYRAVSGEHPTSQIEVADALFEATFRACWETIGDLGRFVGTGMVARDLDAIRQALAEPQLTGYLVSYGTGIGQTYAQMFPGRVGAVILDGTEYVPFEWMQGGFGWAALDNITDAWHDGFLGECIAAGPKHCALAANNNISGTGSSQLTVDDLEARMADLVASVAKRPVAAYTAVSGPTLITYSSLVASIYSALYRPRSWPAMAQMLFELEQGNSTLAAVMVDALVFQYDPSRLVLGEACSVEGVPAANPPLPSTNELAPLVICADQYDAPEPAGGLSWWDELWANMTAKSWIGGNSRFYNVLPCRHYKNYWPEPAGVFRAPSLNATLSNPVLLVAETHDPATPLANGRRLAADMGYANARMVVHHGYGHASMADRSACTDAALKRYVLGGETPEVAETHCFADEKPYLYGVVSTKDEYGQDQQAEQQTDQRDMVAVWREHLQEMLLWNPGLVRR